MLHYKILVHLLCITPFCNKKHSKFSITSCPKDFRKGTMYLYSVISSKEPVSYSKCPFVLSAYYSKAPSTVILNWC